MNGMRAILDRASSLWRSFSFNQKAIVCLVAGASLLSVVIFSVWVRSDSMAVLFSNLAPEDASEVLEEASKRGVRAELSNGGRTVMVPSREALRLRVDLASRGIPGEGGIGFELFDQTRYGMTDFLENVTYKRALEGELARSIGSIEGVDKARVHITLPEQSVFLRERVAPSASVLLSLRRARRPSSDQIEGIQHLVSSAVEGMEPQGVTVLDGRGAVLSNEAGNDGIGLSNAQLRLRQEVEQYLAVKSTDLLSAVVGQGRSVVRVNADIDFDRIERTQEQYDPQTVVRSEQRDESADPSTGATNESLVTNYELNHTVERVLQNGGGLRKLTVAVFVDGTYPQAADGSAPVFQPRTAEEIGQIQRIVSGAVGLDDQRGDSIEVVSMPFQTEPVPAMGILDGPWVQTLPSIVGRIVLFLVAAFLILNLRKSLGQIVREASRPLAPASTQGTAATAAGPSGLAPGAVPDPGADRAATDLENWAETSPDEVARLIESFATQDDPVYHD